MTEFPTSLIWLEAERLMWENATHPTTSDTWLHARELAGLCVTCQSGAYHELHVDRDICHLVIDRTLGKRSRHGMVYFDLANGFSSEGFTCVSASERTGNLRTMRKLLASGIEYQESGRATNFHFKWTTGTTDSRNGRLSFMRIDLDSSTFVNYYAIGTPRAHKLAHGNPKLLAKLPAILDGTDILLGQTIPWTIDFEAEARDILDKSLLGALAERFTRKIAA